MNMLHNESRNLLVQAFEKNHNAKQTAEDFSVSLWTVYRLRQQMKQTGSVDLRVNQRGRKAKLTRQDLDAVNEMINKQPDLSIREIKERLHLNVCEETVRKAVIKLGYRVKKKSVHASEQERSRRESLDESGVNLGMIRRYGRAVGGKRVVDHAPLTRPRATTLLSAIRVNKVIAQTSYLGGTTRSKFQQYVQETLLPELNPGDIVVMDNLAAHHGPGIAQMIAQAGAQILYLPPYSPDFNPIEKLWSKMKAYLRKYRALTFEDLDLALYQAFAAVTSSDCRNWFACAGYC